MRGRNVQMWCAVGLLSMVGTAQAEGVSRSERLQSRLEALQEAAELPDGARHGCLTTVLSEALLFEEELEPELLFSLDPYLVRPTDDTEQIGSVNVSYAALGATVVVSKVVKPFKIWYALDSTAAVSTTDVSPQNGTPDFVDQVLTALQTAYAYEVTSLGFRPPMGDGNRGDGENLFDVYLTELSTAGAYGYVSTDTCTGPPWKCAGYMVLDDDYAESVYGANGLEGLQVTVAHEFFHAIQFAYEVEDNAWWLENTSTWMEDEVYDGINDYVGYLGWRATQPTLPLDTANGQWEYGNMVWPVWLSAQYGSSFIRDVFDGIAAVGGDNTLAALVDSLTAEDVSLPKTLLEHQLHNQNKGRYAEGSSFWGSVSRLTPSKVVTTYPSSVTSESFVDGTLPRLGAQLIRLEPTSTSGTWQLEVKVDLDDRAELEAGLVLETACNTPWEKAFPLDAVSRAGSLIIPGFGSKVRAATVVLVNGCQESNGCDRLRYRVDATTTTTSAVTDADGDCVPPMAVGGTDCDDAQAARGPFATESTDGLDNDCDGAVDEAPGLARLTASSLYLIQGQDYDLTFTSRYLSLGPTSTYEWSAGDGSLSSLSLVSDHQARAKGMIGVLADPTSAFTAYSGQDSGEGVVYVGSNPRTALTVARAVSGTVSIPGAGVLFEVQNSTAQRLLARASSNGTTPFTPLLRWVGSDGLKTLYEHAEAAGVEAPVGTVYLRVSDAAGGGSSGHRFSLVLSSGCAEDVDGDGHVSEVCPQGDDCVDTNAAAHPGAVEVPYDGIDQDCDGEDLVDQDGDGVAGIPGGGQDCDDGAANVYPGAAEVCDALDNDCDGQANEGLTGCTLEACDGKDNDGDGLTDEGFDADGLGGPDCIDNDGDGFTELEGDCDDSTVEIAPQGGDIPYDGIDQDCLGGDEVDLDDDGYASTLVGGGDCQDLNPLVHPTAPEACDQVDNDCDGQTDEGTDLDGLGGTDCVDDDKDGYSELQGDCRDDNAQISPARAEVPYDGVDQDCTGSDLTDVDGDGYVGVEAGGTDCLDKVAVAHPGGTEVCDGYDNDCDDQTDEGFDADGVGGADCLDGDSDGQTELQGDCRDDDASVKTGGVEVCDGKDNTCEGSVDEGFDADGVGGADCTDGDGDGVSEAGGDCDDSSLLILPGAEELCDDVDNDCDEDVDEGWDQDGLGGPDCTDDDFDKISEDDGDCNDENRGFYPGADEVPYNGKDEDCTGSDLTDVDGDGYDAEVVEGGTDCDDQDPKTYPGAPEVAYNDEDEDCNGYDFQDSDLDGYSSPAAGGEDCDDFNPAVHPKATEVPYNGLDDDCVDGDLTDVDGDRFDALEVGGEDCDDTSPSVYPYAQEVAYDGIDQDCEDGDLDDVDDDQFAAVEAGGSDCNDDNPLIHPKAQETCNDGLDDDCDGRVDNGCTQDNTGGCNCDLTASSRGPTAGSLLGAGLGLWLLARRRGRGQGLLEADGATL